MKRLQNDLEGKKLFLLDIDGTIGFDSDLFPGAMDFFHQVQSIGGKYIFITNNSTKSIQDYVTKFEKMGVPVDESNFVTSSFATALYLQANHADDLLYVLGTESFCQELRDHGLTITDEVSDDVAAVVVGFDSELTYDKITKACELLETRDVLYYATNPDLVCPVGFGFVPDCGAICDMLKKAVHKDPLFIGKPSASIVSMCLEATGFHKEETVVIGDRLYTDIACGLNAGVDTIVVFTGEAKLEDLQKTEFQPDYYCDTIKDIYHSLCYKEKL